MIVWPYLLPHSLMYCMPLFCSFSIGSRIVDVNCTEKKASTKESDQVKPLPSSIDLFAGDSDEAEPRKDELNLAQKSTPSKSSQQEQQKDKAKQQVIHRGLNLEIDTQVMLGDVDDSN